MRDQRSVNKTESEKTSRSRIVVGVTFEGTRFVYEVMILLHSFGERRLEIRWIERVGVGRESV
jgi:hypothetical protein